MLNTMENIESLRCDRLDCCLSPVIPENSRSNSGKRNVTLDFGPYVSNPTMIDQSTKDNSYSTSALIYWEVNNLRSKLLISSSKY